MRSRMPDITAISNSVGHFDILIIMTCSIYWSRTQNALLPGRMVENRPDLSDRLFRMKLKLIFEHLKED